MKYFWLIGFLIALYACQSKRDTKDNQFKITGDHITLKYAEGFSIKETPDYYILRIKNTFKGNNKEYTYLLYRDSTKIKDTHLAKIRIPVENLAILSSTYIPFLQLIHAENSIKGISGKNTIYDSSIRNKVIANEIVDLGEPELNKEKLLLLSPDVLIAFAIDAPSMNQLLKLEELGQQLVFNAEYMEASPLAKAEWIKFFGVLFDKLELATKVFDEIELKYLKLKKIAENTEERPTVFSAIPWNGTWFVPGGNSFQAQFFKDASANYIWSDNQERVSLPLDFEVVLNKALEADYWLNVSNIRSLKELEQTDERFRLFKAFKDQKVYNNTKTLTSYFGNDYWEGGAAHPDLILEDLIHIFHPYLDSNYNYHYYEKLNE